MPSIRVGNVPCGVSLTQARRFVSTISKFVRTEIHSISKNKFSVVKACVLSSSEKVVLM